MISKEMKGKTGCWNDKAKACDIKEKHIEDLPRLSAGGAET